MEAQTYYPSQMTASLSILTMRPNPSPGCGPGIANHCKRGQFCPEIRWRLPCEWKVRSLLRSFQLVVLFVPPLPEVGQSGFAGLNDTWGCRRIRCHPDVKTRRDAYVRVRMFQRMRLNLSGHFQHWDTSRQIAARVCLPQSEKSSTGFPRKCLSPSDFCRFRVHRPLRHA